MTIYLLMLFLLLTLALLLYPLLSQKLIVSNYTILPLI